MILFLGDLHYLPPGAASRHDQAAGIVGGIDDDRELASCVESVADSLTDVVVLGDVFDAFVEYRHLIPRSPLRSLGLLARLADSGVDIAYVVGNHDPWHRTFVEQELGFRLIRRGEARELQALRLYYSHGDQEEHASTNLVRAVTRSRLAQRLFTGVTPGDFGQGLALRVSRSWKRSGQTSRTAAVLRQAATRLLENGDLDAVVMAHSHEPELLTLPFGTYLNPGFWPTHRMVGVLEAGELSLRTWRDHALEPHPPLG